MLRICRDSSELIDPDHLSPTAKRLSVFQQIPLQNMIKNHQKSEEIRGCFQVDDGSMTFQTKAFRLFPNGKNTDKTRLPADQQNRLVLEAYSVSSL